jgi:hypothetical protein
VKYIGRSFCDLVVFFHVSNFQTVNNVSWIIRAFDAALRLRRAGSIRFKLLPVGDNPTREAASVRSSVKNRNHHRDCGTFAHRASDSFLRATAGAGCGGTLSSDWGRHRGNRTHHLFRRRRYGPGRRGPDSSVGRVSGAAGDRSPGLLFRKEALEQVGGLDESIGNFPGIGDYNLIWTLLESRATLIEAPLYNYRDHNEERLRLADSRIPEKEIPGRVRDASRWYGRPIYQVIADS